MLPGKILPTFLPAQLHLLDDHLLIVHQSVLLILVTGQNGQQLLPSVFVLVLADRELVDLVHDLLHLFLLIVDLFGDLIGTGFEAGGNFIMTSLM